MIHQDQRTVLYTSSCCQVEHLSFSKTIYYKLKGYLEEDAALNFFNTILYFTEQINSQNLIAELSEFKGFHMKMAKYGNQVWSRKLARQGIKRVAIIIPKSRFGAFCSRVVSGQEAHAHLCFREFYNLQETRTWIYQEAGTLPY